MMNIKLSLSIAAAAPAFGVPVVVGASAPPDGSVPPVIIDDPLFPLTVGVTAQL